MNLMRGGVARNWWEIVPDYNINDLWKRGKEYFPTNLRRLVVNEDMQKDLQAVPRFTPKDKSWFPDFEPGKSYPFSQEKIIKAIQNGMIVLIRYQGEGDELQTGRERVIYPMAYGKSKDGKLLLRGWQLKGWSFSRGGKMEREWRMFRGDRIKSISFTGSLFRLPPEGYNMFDKGMKGGLIISADFKIIQKNQLALLGGDQIQNSQELDMKSAGMNTIVVKFSETDLDLEKFSEENKLGKIEKDQMLLVFLKQFSGNGYMVITGAKSEKGKSVRIYTDKNHYLGVYKVLESLTYAEVENMQKIENQTVFPLYEFIKKK